MAALVVKIFLLKQIEFFEISAKRKQRDIKTIKDKAKQGKVVVAAYRNGSISKSSKKNKKKFKKVLTKRKG